MASLVAFALLAAAASSGPPPAPAHVPTSAIAPAQASVRILSAARVTLSNATQPDGYAMKPARVTVEDGTQRDAKLVEFQ
jgi:hypothetical protein